MHLVKLDVPFALRALVCCQLMSHVLSQYKQKLYVGLNTGMT